MIPVSRSINYSISISEILQVVVTMPKKHSLPLRKMMLAVTHLDEEQRSIREVSQLVGVPKSTLHDNIADYRLKIDQFELWLRNPTQFVVRSVLILILTGRCSARACAKSISDCFGIEISHKVVLSILNKAAEIATEINEQTSLENVNCAAFDEVFQKRNPILGFCDPVSGVVSLKPSEQRDKKHWSNYLEILQRQGLDPDSHVTDGALGLISALQEHFKGTHNLRDCFHVLHKLFKALQKIETKSYSLMGEQMKRPTDEITELMWKAIDLHDELELLCRGLKYSFGFAATGCDQYVSSDKLKEHISKCVDLLSKFLEIKEYKSVKDAMTYLKNGADAIVKYKQIIENFVSKRFPSLHHDTILSFLCPLIDATDQYKRSYENKAAQVFWARRIAELRSAFRVPFADQDEIDKAINDVTEIMNMVRKSNSLIECINGVIRQHLFTYKSIPTWFCPLFIFFWNHRRFDRGKRKGFAPVELLNGKRLAKEWIDILVERFPFEEIKSLRTPIPLANAG